MSTVDFEYKTCLLSGSCSPGEEVQTRDNVIFSLNLDEIDQDKA